MRRLIPITLLWTMWLTALLGCGKEPVSHKETRLRKGRIPWTMPAQHKLKAP